MIPTRAADIVDEALRRRMRALVATRDGVDETRATEILNRMSPAELTRLELELRDRPETAHTHDYDPYGGR